MRYFFTKIMLFCCLLFYLFPIIGQAKPAISANNAVLMEQKTGRVLFEENAHDRESIASITKVMTAIIAIEYGNLKENVAISQRAIYTEGSSIYLENDKTMTLEDLIYGLMLRSGNDAAVAIAEHIGESVEGFVYLMNEKARYLGMTNTNFANPHGLEENNHYSTAYDMALLMRYAMENETFQTVSGTKVYLSKDRAYPWHNKNKLLTKLYEYCTGGKTGFTKKAGRTLLTTAEKDDVQLIAVTLNASSDWNDHTSLYEWGFESFELKKLEEKGDFFFLNNENELIEGHLAEDVFFILHKDELAGLTKTLQIKNSDAADLQAEIIYRLNNSEIINVPVFVTAAENPPHLLATFEEVFFKLIQVNQHG